MRKYQDAAELIEAYNTPRSAGGLMGDAQPPYIRKSIGAEHTICPAAGETCLGAAGQVLTANGAGGWVLDGKIVGYGGSTTEYDDIYKVVAWQPSGAFKFEKVYGEFATRQEAEALLAALNA